MTPRSLLPAAAVVAALAVMTAAYQLATHADLPPRPDADRVRSGPELPAGNVMEALFVRSAARNLVAREVIAGRATVPEAAALIGWIDALPPRPPAIQTGQVAAMAGLPDSGGYTAAELLGVRVVMHVGVAERNDAVGPPGSVGRARAAFLAARARGEFTKLPEPPADRCEWLLEQARTEANKHTFGRPDARPVQAAE